MRQAGPLTIFLDFIEAVLLSVFFVILSPVRSLQSISRLSHLLDASSVLGRYGLLASTMRSFIDLRFGRLDRSVTILESVAGALEEYHFESPAPGSERILEWLFSTITSLYLASGHIDDAALTVIRANKSIGVSQLKGLPNLDVKTAHIVKAGIAAGKLLDENGSATFMVQASELENRRRRRLADRRRVVSTDDEKPVQGKVIPFPVPQKP